MRAGGGRDMIQPEGEATMQAWAYGVAVLFGVSALWVMSGTQRPASILASRSTESLRALEATAAAHPEDAATTRRLAQAYLDARQPGLAVALLRAAPTAVRDDVRARHVLARALLDQGRNDQALDIESGVVASCRSPWGGIAPGCDPVLFASAVRRASILQEMLTLGVKDAVAHPEASLIAYQKATREARVSLE
jgi:hypothetical protein